MIAGRQLLLTVHKQITVSFPLPKYGNRSNAFLPGVVFQPQAYRAVTSELEILAAYAGTVGVGHHFIAVPLFAVFRAGQRLPGFGIHIKDLAVLGGGDPDF